MNESGIEMLKKIPVIDKMLMVEIVPLAPLSMVSDLPGSYYKTLKSPSKKMLCGLFENILGWHIDAADRKAIINDLKKVRKKQNMEFPITSGSSYMPLLMEYFDIKQCFKSDSFQYDDYWSKAFRRADAIVHPKGTINISHELIPIKRELPRNETKPKLIDDKELEIFFKKEKNSYPLYYSSPTTREYIKYSDHLSVQVAMDSDLSSALLESFKSNNLSYLGTSEGWVDVKLLEL